MDLASFIGKVRKFFFGNSKSFVLESGAKITVLENGFEKKLLYNGYTYSKIPKNGIFTHEYWDYLLPLAYLHDSPKILMIGLGGGTVPWQLSKLDSNARITAIESSKKMVEIEREFAGPLKSLNIVVGDGAKYVAESKEKYDYIILDAYISGSIPPEFLDKKFIDDSYNVLAEDGILAINYIANAEMQSYLSLLKMRYKVFVVRTSLFSANSIIVASKLLGKAEIVKEIEAKMPLKEENGFLIDAYMQMAEA